MLYFQDASGRVRDMSCLHFICAVLNACIALRCFGQDSSWLKMSTCLLRCILVSS